jgi:hypothetical protein
MKRLRWYDYLSINLFWLGLNIRNTAVGSVFTPYLVALFVPEVRRNTALGAARMLAVNQVFSRKYDALLPLGVSLILTVNGISYIKTVVYLLMLFQALFLWFPGWFRLRKKEPQTC